MMESFEKPVDLGIDTDQPLGDPLPVPKQKSQGEPGLLKAFFSTMFGKVLFGISCSIMATMIVQSATLIAVIQFICAIIGLAGDKSVTEKAKRIFSDGQEVVAKVEAKAEPAPVANAPVDRPSLKEQIAEKAVEPLKEKVEETREKAVEKVVEVKTEAKEQVQEVKDTITGVGERIGQGAQAAKEKVGDMGRGAAAGASNLRQGMMDAQRQVKAANSHAAACPRCGVRINLPPNAQKQRTCLSCYTPYTPAQACQAAQRGWYR